VACRWWRPGNLAFVSLDPAGPGPDVEFAQVVRDESGEPGSNWKAVVDGFSLMHVMEVVDPLDCAADSALIVNGAARVLGPALQWIADVFDPFVPWRYACEDAAVAAGLPGLAGGIRRRDLPPRRPGPSMLHSNRTRMCTRTGIGPVSSRPDRPGGHVKLSILCGPTGCFRLV
jgi:hypothetical protein